MKVIEVNQLSKVYELYKKQTGLKGSIKNLFCRETKHKTAVESISFDVEKGDIVGFVGLNGAGKTTTLKMLSGILKPTSGTVSVLGYNPFDKETEYLKKITMVMGSKTQLWWDIPASETFELNRRIFNVDKQKYDELLDYLVDRLEVKDLVNVQVRKLSLGERMKMEFIAALIHSPEVLFLDEPTIGLDIFSQESIRSFLCEYNKEFNTTIILTSHNFDDISELCNKLILINKGNVLYNNDYNVFLNEYGKERILAVKFKKNFELKELFAKIKDYEYNVNGDDVTIKVLESQIVSVSRMIMDLYAEYIEDISIKNLQLTEIIKKVYTE